MPPAPPPPPPPPPPAPRPVRKERGTQGKRRPKPGAERLKAGVDERVNGGVQLTATAGATLLSPPAAGDWPYQRSLGFLYPSPRQSSSQEDGREGPHPSLEVTGLPAAALPWGGMGRGRACPPLHCAEQAGPPS